MDISIIVPSYQSEETIADTIESLVTQRTDRSYEIIIVDSSSDRTPDIVSRYSDVNLVRLSRRAYSGEARNVGIRYAQGRIIAFTDSDCMPEPDWLQKMWETHAFFDCAAVGGAVTNGNPDSLISWASYITEFSQVMPVGKMRFGFRCVTCNVSYKSWVFKEYGGFDPSLKRYVDFAFHGKLCREGEQLLFDPGILVSHRHRVTLRRYTAHEFSRGRAALIVRRMGLLPGARITASRCVSAAITPILLARRMIADSSRVIEARGEVLCRFPAVFPFFVAGSVAWTCGFAMEALTPLRKRGLRHEEIRYEPVSEDVLEVTNE